MVSTDKLIKVGVKYSDSYFETLKNIYNNAYRNNESLEEFLNDTQDYSIGNPLEAGGFKDTLTNLIASSTNDIRFSRPAQKALMNTIIRNTTGELIVDVGNDVKQSVRDIVAKGYNTRTLSRQNVADEISSTLDGINRKRARTIARTEIKRAQTTSNYVVALDRGANAYKYKCGATPCDICKVDCGKTYPITDLEHLPPRHPNCMCSVSFFKDPNLPDVKPPVTVEEPTTAQLKKNLTPAEREKYFNYKRNIPNQLKWLRENPNANAEDIAKHKNRLAFLQKKFEELRVKALGGKSGGSPKPTPKPKPKPKLKSESEIETKPKKKIERNPNNKKFEDLVTLEDVAEYFGFEYSFGKFPQVDKENEVMVGKDGRRYSVGKNENKRGKYHKFYDPEHDCTIYLAQSITKPSKAKDSAGKIYIDTSNSGKGVKNLRDVIKMYDDAPKILKETNTSITFTNRKAKRLRAFNRMMDKVWVENLKHNEAFEKQITYGKKAAWIDMYINCIEDDLDRGHSMQRTLYHEMAHGLDNDLSKSWSSSGRFSDNRKPDGYGALIKKQAIFDEKTKRRIGWTSEEIVDGLSSEYGERHWNGTFSYSEDFADAVSMVAFKNMSDKSGAVILPPGWTWTNNVKALTYKEWITKYKHKYEYLAEVLSI